MSQKQRVAGIRQECPKDKLNINKEVVARELESDLQELNKLRAEDFVTNPSEAGGLKVMTMSGNQNRVVRKTFWFENVEVNSKNGKVVVVFDDGHKEVFNNAEIWNKFPTLNPSDYGPVLKGVFENPSTGTMHLVNDKNELVCGRRDKISSMNISRIDTTADDISYNSFCSQCTHAYDGLIVRAADLSLPIK